MNRSTLSAAALLLLVVACSDSRPAVALPTPDDPSNDAGPSTSGDAATTDADSSSPTDGGQDAGPDAWVPGPSVCNPNMTLGTVTPIASTAADDRFGAITADEQTIAWTVPSGASAMLQIADRASTADPFGTPQSPAELVASDGVALAPSGLTLVAIAEDHRSFVVFERASRTDAFAIGDAGVYSSLVAALGAEEKLGDPVFGYGDLVLVYSVYGGASSDTVRYATRLSSGSPWNVAGSLAFTELRAQGNKRRRPSGIGDDFQTLFYWDEVSATEKLGRLEGTTAFYDVHDLGARAFAQPNGTCSRVYYGAAGAGGSDIVSAIVQ